MRTQQHLWVVVLGSSGPVLCGIDDSSCTVLVLTAGAALACHANSEKHRHHRPVCLICYTRSWSNRLDESFSKVRVTRLTHALTHFRARTRACAFARSHSLTHSQNSLTSLTSLTSLARSLAPEQYLKSLYAWQLIPCRLFQLGVSAHTPGVLAESLLPIEGNVRVFK